LGAWLHASPISSVGLRMDDRCLRIAVGLRLGTSICTPHICQHCGAEMSARGLHGLSRKYSDPQRHRSLSAAGVPSRLKPPGLLQSDGKRPNGMTLAIWWSGRPLVWDAVWDATCPDTFAVSYRGCKLPPQAQPHCHFWGLWGDVMIKYCGVNLEISVSMFWLEFEEMWA